MNLKISSGKFITDGTVTSSDQITSYDVICQKRVTNCIRISHNNRSKLKNNLLIAYNANASLAWA